MVWPMPGEADFRGLLGEALHEYLGELTSVRSALVEGGAVREDEGDPFWCRRTARLATLAARAREEDGDCKPHRWHVYQVLHQYLAAADRWPREHRPYLGARALQTRRAMRPRESCGSEGGRREWPGGRRCTGRRSA